MTGGPRFTHDRACCSFLGSEGRFDVYSCPTKPCPTILVRFGNEGWAFCSGASFFTTTPDFTLDWVQAGLTVVARHYLKTLKTLET